MEIVVFISVAFVALTSIALTYAALLLKGVRRLAAGVEVLRSELATARWLLSEVREMRSRPAELRGD